MLNCPHLSRSRARVKLSAKVGRKVAGHPLSLVIKVTGRHGRLRPSRLVTVRAGHRTVARLPLNSRTGSARTTVVGKSAGKLVAVYAGDGYFRPARSKTTRPR